MPADTADSSVRLFYGFQLVVLLAALVLLVPGIGGFAGIALGVLLGALVAATALGLWRTTTDRESEHPGTAADIAHDPFADPGQAARQRWERAVSRLPDDDQD
jgi:hypothetical protein